MSPRKAIKNLADTPFSQDRLIIWTLGISSVLSLVFIFVLAYQGKEVPPSLTMAFGVVTMAFSQRFEKDNK